MSRSQTNQVSLVWYVMPALWLAVAVTGYVAVAFAPEWFRESAPHAAPPAAPRHARAASPALESAEPRGRDAQDHDFAHVVALFRETRWAAAYGRVSELADEGHPEAARIALFMLRYGNELFGSPWSATEDQVDTWIQAAARPARRRDLSGGD